MRPPLPRLVVLAVLAPVLAIGACGSETKAPESFPPGAIVVTAQNRTFDTSQLVLPAGTPFVLVLVNRDADQHNIAIRTKPGFDGDLVFRHDPISASTVVLNAGPIAAGSYFFLCEVHPTMAGTVIVR